MPDFNSDIIGCLQELKEGRPVLIHTEAGWLLAADARTPAPFFERVNRPVLMLADARDLFVYLSAPPLNIMDELESDVLPTAHLVTGVLDVDNSWLDENQGIAVTLARDEFSLHLVKRFRHPLVLLPVTEWNGFRAGQYCKALSQGFLFT
ncbi:hypothetical protein ACFSQD_02010 [Flavihumibacter stibioxidans]|uniref:YrdC-like domain-containing protein n=1 Tax=Flavihumibacter stibioxidans TaxID=1834163 RepID=A0ABR7MB45_9BACT|nr:hypothetical protein [Flavihumibacter stibioxidans]MBC6492258.1 hypothetical protein [Flavihumibacter stibioxidans]